MQGQHKDVVKNITSASQLESELQISQAQHGVVVLDVYNAEWGNAKALSETFRLLHTNAGDTVHLRFFSVECNAVVESLQDPDDKKKAMPKPKGLQPSPDTLSTFWSSYVENRVRHSKPYFMFFKEGQFRAQIEGIDTPRITRIVTDLCKQQNPVTDYVTNTDLLRFWQRHFSTEESEVPLTRFMHAIREERTASGLAELTSADITALSGAVDAHGDTVMAAGCQAWVGEQGTVMGRVIDLVGAASAPQVNLEPSFVASPSAAETASRGSIAAAADAAPSRGSAPSHGSASFSRDLQSWREIQEAGAPGTSTTEASAPAAADEAHRSPSLSQDPQSWRDISNAAAAGAESGEHTQPDQWAELGDEEAQREPETQAAADEEAPVHAADEQHADKWAELGDEETPVHAAEAETAEKTEEAAQKPAEEEQHADKWAELGDEETAAAPEAQTQPDQWAELGDEETPRDPETHAAEQAVEGEPAAVGREESDKWAELGDEAVPTESAGEAVANQIFVNEQWVRVSDEEMRVWNVVADLPLHYPEHDGAMLTRYTADTAVALPESPDAVPTLPSFLEARGANAVEVNMMCLAADQKIGSESVSLGKLALVLMSCDDAASQQLISAGGDYYGEVCDGSLLHKNAPLGYTALCLCASQAYPDEYFFYVPAQQDMSCLDGLKEGDEVTLAALAPLATQVPEGTFAVRVVGLPKVIELATTDRREETMVLSQWVSRLVVAEKSDTGVTLSFLENIENERFEAFATAYTARLLEEESRLDKKNGPSDGAPELGDAEL